MTRTLMGSEPSLMLKHSERLSSARFVNLSMINDLNISTVQKREDVITIGSMVTWSTISEDPVLSVWTPILQDLSRQLGNPQIRHVATIGGNLCTGQEFGDCLPVLLALDARLVIRSRLRQREMAVADYAKDPSFGSSLLHGKLITEVKIPLPDVSSFQFYRKIRANGARSQSSLAIAAVGLANGNQVSTLRFSISVPGTASTMCYQTADLLEGANFSRGLYPNILEGILSDLFQGSGISPQKVVIAQVAARSLLACLHSIFTAPR